MTITNQDRGQGGIRVLFALLAVFFVVFLGIIGVLMPILEILGPEVTGSSAVQNAGWLDGGATGFFTRLRLIGYIGVPMTIIGMFIAWVFVWYIRRQGRTGIR